MTGSTGAASNEFVELFNAGSSAADVGGFKVAYRSSAGTSDITLVTIPAGTSIPAGGFYLLGGSGYLGSHAADQSFSASLASTGGGIAVRDATGGILDSVGYGDTTNAFVEAHPTTAPPTTAAPGSSSGRIPDGHDTNDNAADFSVERDTLSGRREPLGRPGGRCALRAARQSLQRGMLGRSGLPILSSRGHTLAWRIQKTAETAAIGLIHQQRLERLLSPELMLVDAELAERARALLREPHEANGKGSHMSALGTHEFTAGTSLGLEPPLSPPVVRGPVASAMPVGDGGISELPSPPPAIRPPEAAPGGSGPGSGARAGPGRDAPAARAGGSACSGARPCSGP